jgi:serine/threonine protein kinase
MELEHQELLEKLQAVTHGEYEVLWQIGRGGMATVFLAREISLDRWVAIKVINSSEVRTPTLVERFLLEARTAAGLSHPNIIPIYSVRTVENVHFFVMKHVNGGSLDGVLQKEGPLSIPLIRTILRQVATALAHAHSRGVIHRDVKPANIMLDAEGVALVSDFGIAKVSNSHHLTDSGLALGTPYYMSPEQFDRSGLDGRSDQYSLGAVAFELLTGRRPFNGSSMPEILRGHLLETPPDVRELRPDCPPFLAEAIARMLQKVPDHRYPLLSDVATLIETMPGGDRGETRQQISSLARSMSMEQPRAHRPIAEEVRGRASFIAPSASTNALPPHGNSRLPKRYLRIGGISLAILATTTALAVWFSFRRDDKGATIAQSDSPPRAELRPDDSSRTSSQQLQQGKAGKSMAANSTPEKGSESGDQPTQSGGLLREDRNESGDSTREASADVSVGEGVGFRTSWLPKSYNQRLPSGSFVGPIMIAKGVDPALQPQQLSVEVWYRTPETRQSGTIMFLELYPPTSYAPPYAAVWFRLNTFNNSQSGLAPVFSVSNGGRYNNLAPIVGPGTVTNNLAYSTWYHLVATDDGQFASIFVNGLLAGAIPVRGAIQYGPTDARIAGMRNGQENGYDPSTFTKVPGELRLVKLYNRALSPYEIEANYKKGVPSANQ